MLYASAGGIPSVRTPITGQLATSFQRILAMLAVFLLIDQNPTVQLLPQQALSTFLTLMAKLDPSIVDPGP